VATLKVFYLRSYSNAFWYTTFLVHQSLEVMLMMHHHGDDVYMMSQLCCGLRNVAAKF